MAPNTRSTNKNIHPGQVDVTKKRRSSAQVGADTKRAEAIEESIIQAQQQKEHDLAVFEKAQHEAAELEKKVASNPSKLTAPSTGSVTRTVRSVKLVLPAEHLVIAEGAGTNVNDKRMTEQCSRLLALEPRTVTSSLERADSVASGDSSGYEYYPTQRSGWAAPSQWYSGLNPDAEDLDHSQVSMISNVTEIEVHRGDIRKPLKRKKSATPELESEDDPSSASDDLDLDSAGSEEVELMKKELQRKKKELQRKKEKAKGGKGKKTGNSKKQKRVHVPATALPPSIKPSGLKDGWQPQKIMVAHHHATPTPSRVSSISLSQTASSEKSSRKYRPSKKELSQTQTPAIAFSTQFGGYASDESESAIDLGGSTQVHQDKGNGVVVKLLKAEQVPLSKTNVVSGFDKVPGGNDYDVNSMSDNSDHPKSSHKFPGVPQEVIHSFTKKFIPQIIEYLGQSDNPWGPISVEDTQIIFDSVYPNISYAITKKSKFWERTVQKTYNWRTHIGTMACTAVQAFFFKTEKNHKDIRDYVKQALEAQDNVPFIWEHYRLSDIPDRQGRYKIDKSGGYQNEILLKTFAVHFGVSGIRCEPRDLSPNDFPSGALALSCAAVERAIGAWSSGQPVYTDINRFSATAWQDTTCRHLLGIKESTYRWSMILRATAMIRKKTKDARVETLASQSMDPRINVGHSDPAPEL